MERVGAVYAGGFFVAVALAVHHEAVALVAGVAALAAPDAPGDCEEAG